MAVNPFSGQKVEGFARFYREKSLRHMCVCVKHNCTYIIVRVFLFQIIMCTRLQSITVQCVSACVDQLANILNSCAELLISGRGKSLTLLKIVESELEKLWTDSLTFPTCHSCLINIILLMGLVLKVYKFASPRSLCNLRL